MSKRMILVSRRKQVIDFFTLEAKLWEYDLSVSPVHLDIYDNIDVLICDGIEPVNVPLKTKIYKLVDVGNDDDGTIVFPVSLDTLRSIFADAVGNDQVEASDADIIYMKQCGREVNYKGMFYNLTENEFRLLERLGESCSHAVVTREDLMELLGAEAGNITDVYVSRLRKKLEDPLGPRIIETVRGKGYKLRVKIKKYT